MFKTIFSFELKRWFSNPSFYIYFALFFAISFLFGAVIFGFFDSVTASAGSNAYVNSPVALNSFINGLNYLIYFLLPIVIGSSVYRDFRYNMHTILFSYPFSKMDYIAGKFLSSLLVVILITLSIVLGIIVASVMPIANQAVIAPFDIMAYVQIYAIYVIPNLFFFGVIVFGLVTLSRNISVGFIGVIVLILIKVVISSFTRDIDNRYQVALWEPFGEEAAEYYTKYWTVAEQNVNMLPFEGVIIYNRLLWLGISIVVFFLVYSLFSFSQTGLTISRSKKKERLTKNNFGGIVRIVLPKVKYDFSTWQNIKTALSLSRYDFSYIVRNWTFITISFVGLLVLILMSATAGEIFGTSTYPVTWQMLMLPGTFFSFFINILTFLFAGMLIHRADLARMKHLVDVTPIPNWVLLLSKFIALLKMQLCLLLLIVIAGVAIQAYHEYYNFELGLYFFELYALKFINFVIWALLALFVHTLFKNYLLGFFVLLLLSIAIQFLPMIGVEQDIFIFNSDTRYSYSDMNGFGSTLPLYYLYKFYWLLFGLFLYGLSLLLWKRGVLGTSKDNWSNFKSRLKPSVYIPMIIVLIAFLGLGFTFYYQDNVANTFLSSKDFENQRAEYEKKYKKYENYAQPRIVDIKIDMDIFPKERNLAVDGTFVLKNKSSEAIDSLFVSYQDYETAITFSKAAKLVSKDSIFRFDIYKFDTPLAAGDSLTMNFKLKNKENTIFTENSPVLANGTFINNSNFPSIGYSDQQELTDNDVRKKYGLGDKERMAATDDLKARQNNYISGDADWLDFETTVSTEKGQIAIAPGNLVKRWEKDGREYFHYKMKGQMLNFYAYQSADYQVKTDKYKGVAIEIYYDKKHLYNVDRMITSLKKSLDYYTKNFSPYQHDQVRIIEFPRTGGSFAQAFANTIPFSEGIGFIANVDAENDDAVDYPFAVTAHEMAHQWWAHQVIGANVQGATLLSESLSEYSSLMVLQAEYGKGQMRKFLKDALDKYLMGRTVEGKKEKPLMYNENQQYIHYNKGSLVLYALSDYIGEENMNAALSKYIADVAFQQPPYTNSIEFVKYLNAATPDSLKYLIPDMFETITLYENRIKDAKVEELPNGKFKVTIDTESSKYRSDEKGKRIYDNGNGKTIYTTTKSGKEDVKSIPLADYIEIGVFSESTAGSSTNEEQLYLEKRKVTKIDNRYIIIVDKKPTEVGIDPYNKLIDANSGDNRRRL